MDEHKPLDQKVQVGGLLQRFTAASQDLGRAFGTTHGIHHTAARAILELMNAERAGKPMTAGQLGELLQLTPAAVTALVDRMAASGHVARKQDPTDRRRMMLLVKPAAMLLGEQFFRPLAQDLHTLMSNYSDKDLELIGRFLQDSTAVVRNHLVRLS